MWLQHTSSIIVCTYGTWVWLQLPKFAIRTYYTHFALTYKGDLKCFIYASCTIRYIRTYAGFVPYGHAWWNTCCSMSIGWRSMHRSLKSLARGQVQTQRAAAVNKRYGGFSYKMFHLNNYIPEPNLSPCAGCTRCVRLWYRCNMVECMLHHTEETDLRTSQMRLTLYICSYSWQPTISHECWSARGQPHCNSMFLTCIQDP